MHSLFIDQVLDLLILVIQPSACLSANQHTLITCRITAFLQVAVFAACACHRFKQSALFRRDFWFGREIVASFETVWVAVCRIALSAHIMRLYDVDYYVA